MYTTSQIRAAGIAGEISSIDVEHLIKILEERNGAKRYKCLLCGRNKFTRKTPHYCVGGFRKHHIKWM